MHWAPEPLIAHNHHHTQKKLWKNIELRFKTQMQNPEGFVTRFLEG